MKQGNQSQVSSIIHTISRWGHTEQLTNVGIPNAILARTLKPGPRWSCFSLRNSQVQIMSIIWNNNIHKNTSDSRGKGLNRNFEVSGEQWLAGLMHL